MDTEAADFSGLDSCDWQTVVETVVVVSNWLSTASPGDARIAKVVEKLVGLGEHDKWEVRQAVAAAAGRTSNPSFDAILSQLVSDDNARVCEAAKRAGARRRGWAQTSAYGKQHEDRLNLALDEIGARFGVTGREAVKRAAGRMSETFARELYHEVVGLITPLVSRADRLRTLLADQEVPRETVVEEVVRIEARLHHLQKVMDGMRSYAAEPNLELRSESLSAIVQEAVGIAEGACATRATELPVLEVELEETRLLVARSRMVQALTNLIQNALEAHDGLPAAPYVSIASSTAGGRAVITIRDRGCGMSASDIVDAKALFVTSKDYGTGFGLPLSMKIIESEHDGRLEIESEKGSGTTVRVSLPTSGIVP